MAYIMIDHRGTQDPDGSRGRLVEMDAVQCVHCQALISILRRGCTTEKASHYRCGRCHGPICRFCGEQRSGVCTPFPALVERALKTQRGLEWSEYHYHATTRN